ncbi:MAG: T9SS type A sorting domain-containing protein [Deltaproteobacteria bacterium]
MQRIFVHLLLIAGLTVPVLRPASGQGRYTVTDLGTLGGQSSYARAINDAGTVVGYVQSTFSMAFVYQNKAMDSLGTLGGLSSVATYIGDSGKVVGYSVTSAPLVTHGFLYRNKIMRDLGPPGSSAYGINTAGSIVGVSVSSAGNAHPALYENGTWTDLGTLGGRLGGALRINNSGMIVGNSQLPGDSIYHPFLYQNGTMSDLGTLGGLNSFAHDINDAGAIVGQSSVLGPGSPIRPFLYNKGTMTDIGTFGGLVGSAEGINNSETVVGYSRTAANIPHAFVYEGGVMTDLNGVTDTTGGWVLQFAYGINNRGEIVGHGIHNGKVRAFLLTPPPRRPVLIVHGIGATYPIDVNNVAPWMFTRGIHPTGLQIDPLAHAYDDLIQTLKNVGYVEGKDLFIVNYDWRVAPGPADGVFDGVVNGISAVSITDPLYQYAVDYLGYYLVKAMDAWQVNHPGATLDSVDIIAHSTGGLVARTYIQSAAYGGTFAGSRRLPKVANLIMIGVPNRGASKPWNPLHDNWGVDITFQLVLSKIINLGYQKVLAGAVITGPDIDISLASITPPACQDSQKICFVHQFNPTARSLLATYNFIDFGSGFTNVNSSPSDRNDLVLDLNAGLDLALNGDPNAFSDRTRATVIYATNVATPTAVVKKVGPSGRKNAIVPFTDFATRDARPGEVWYDDIVAPSSGDGTVPLESSSGQFIGDSRVNLKPFAKGTNTAEDVSHLGLMYNSDVQKQVLKVLGASFLAADISTTLHAKIASLMSTALNVVTNIIGGNILGAILDPVEGFIVDGNGKRLGFSAATGPVTEIPGSMWFGNANGLGWILTPLVSPVSLHLSGLGGSYYTMVSVLVDSGSSVLIDQGFLAAGATRVLPITSGPTGVDNQGSPLKPKEYSLAQNFPNPFNPSTTIRYGLPRGSFVRLIVYDMLGQEEAVLQNGEQEAGYHEVRFDAAGMASGVYFYRITAGAYVETRKFLLLR